MLVSNVREEMVGPVTRTADILTQSCNGAGC